MGRKNNNNNNRKPRGDGTSTPTNEEHAAAARPPPPAAADGVPDESPVIPKRSRNDPVPSASSVDGNTNTKEAASPTSFEIAAPSESSAAEHSTASPANTSSTPPPEPVKEDDGNQPQPEEVQKDKSASPPRKALEEPTASSIQSSDADDVQTQPSTATVADPTGLSHPGSKPVVVIEPPSQEGLVQSNESHTLHKTSNLGELADVVILARAVAIAAAVWVLVAAAVVWMKVDARLPVVTKMVRRVARKADTVVCRAAGVKHRGLLVDKAMSFRPVNRAVNVARQMDLRFTNGSVELELRRAFADGSRELERSAPSGFTF